MNRDFAFKKVAGRSEGLKQLTSDFLEPDVQQRINIKDALRISWIKQGHMKVPMRVQKANVEMTEQLKGTLDVPIITEAALKEPAFHYQMSDRNKSISNFNDIFSVLEPSDEDAFY